MLRAVVVAAALAVQAFASLQLHLRPLELLQLLQALPRAGRAYVLIADLLGAPLQVLPLLLGARLLGLLLLHHLLLVV